MKFTDFLQQVANTSFAFIPQAKPSLDKALKCKIIAHRGAWSKKILENTHQAFQKAVEAQVWAIEFDIRWSKDNVPLVHHDPNTSRVFQKDFVIEETDSEVLLQECPQIPSLKQMVECYAKKVHFMIEIKEIPTAKQAQVLQDILKPLTPVDDYHFMALELNRFEPLNFVPAKTFVAIGRADIEDIHNQSITMDIGALTGHYLLLHKEMEKMQHNLGRKTGVGFPSSKYGLYREINRNHDWIFTNHACFLQKELNKIRQ